MVERSPATAPPVALTASERLVLEARAALPAGSSAQLAERLGIKDSTVRDALTRLRRKLRGTGDADLVRVARERGRLDAPAARAPDGVAE